MTTPDIQGGGVANTGGGNNAAMGTITGADSGISIDLVRQPPAQESGSPLPLTTPDTQGGGAASTGGGNNAAMGTITGADSGISIDLVRQPSAQETGIITVSLPKEMATAGIGFTFPLPAQIAETATGDATVRVTTLTGAPLPSWLRYLPESKTFVASAVPDGAFPVQVIVHIGGQRTTVVISERKEE